MKKNKYALFLFLILVVSALACNMPTAAPSTDATEEPAEVGTEAPEVVQTEAPTEEVPAGVTVSVSTATNCRTGPDVAYQLLMVVQPGSTNVVVGKYTPLNYWIINMPTGGTCWLWGQYATTVGDVSILPEMVAPAPPPVAQVDPNQNNNENNNEEPEDNGDSGNGNNNNNPNLPVIPLFPVSILPSPPSNVNVSKVCNVNFPNIIQKSTITWDDTGSETGYVVYKDGVAIANLGANVTKYVDSFSVLFGQNSQVTYGVQTVIGNSASSPAQKSIAVCN